MDGWSVATVQLTVPLGLRVAVPLAVALHKLPEGIALGGILRAAVKGRAAALGWCLLAEGTTIVGGALGLAMAPHLGTEWITYPLGIAAGWLFTWASTRCTRSGNGAGRGRRSHRRWREWRVRR